MPLHLLRMDPDPVLSTRWFAAENLLPRAQDDGGYAWHALLCAAFTRELAPKPFRVAVRRGRPPQLLAYTTASAEELMDAAGIAADPLVFAALGLGDRPLQGRAMPAFAAGRTLGFAVRVRPTVRVDRNGDRDRSAEIDAYVAALRAAPEQRPQRTAVCGLGGAKAQRRRRAGA